MLFTQKNRASTNKSNLLLKLKRILSERFDSQKGLAYKNVKWCDPKNWSNDRTYGMDHTKYYS